MNVLAKEMNDSLEKSSKIFFDMLSKFGREIYMPKGIIVQSAEAKQFAKKYNATIGIARENNAPMHLASVNKFFNDLSPDETFEYAIASGRVELRNIWKNKIVEENSNIKDGVDISIPVVTNGLTNALMIVGDLFVNEGDEIIIPDKLWENYNLMYETRFGATIRYFSLFDEKLTGFNTKSLDKAIGESKKEKIMILLNFPNNPTGYTPTNSEVDEITRIIKKYADSGKKILLICDDAYYGLLYEDNLIKSSIFNKMVSLSKNVVAIKIDGISKEEYAWGFRIGFITFMDYDHKPETYRVLEQKVTATLRSSISNCNNASQSIIEKVINKKGHKEEKEEKLAILKARAIKTKEIVYDKKYSDCWDVYPFNSGYFMCIKPKGVNANDVRLEALKQGVGTIVLGDDLRIAFSGVDIGGLEELFEILATAIRRLK
jgi:aspartate/methionine/tyrosine aminotransferase